MGLTELLLIAVGLSMDAFAVSICKGLAVAKATPKHAALAGLYFGGFQFLMPLLGYFLGYKFQYLITRYDHWIAFVLLAVIGGSMVREAFSKEDEKLGEDFGFKSMFAMAVATSIDALAVGVTFAFLSVKILPASLIIGITTFVFSAAGIYIGNIFGAKYKAKAEFAGGCILILIGLKILLEHLGVIHF